MNDSLNNRTGNKDYLLDNTKVKTKKASRNNDIYERFLDRMQHIDNKTDAELVKRPDKVKAQQPLPQNVEKRQSSSKNEQDDEHLSAIEYTTASDDITASVSHDDIIANDTLMTDADLATTVYAENVNGKKAGVNKKVLMIALAVGFLLLAITALILKTTDILSVSAAPDNAASNSSKVSTTPTDVIITDNKPAIVEDNHSDLLDKTAATMPTPETAVISSAASTKPSVNTNTGLPASNTQPDTAAQQTAPMPLKPSKSTPDAISKQTVAPPASKPALTKTDSTKADKSKQDNVISVEDFKNEAQNTLYRETDD